jgi:hypothetical protein
MVYFMDTCSIMVFCYILWNIGIVCCNLVYFSRFGIFYREKSGNPGLYYQLNRRSLFGAGWPDWTNFRLLGDCFSLGSSVLKMTEEAHFWLLFSAVIIMNFFLQKNVKFWRFFSQTHKVTLLPFQSEKWVLGMIEGLAVCLFKKIWATPDSEIHIRVMNTIFKFMPHVFICSTVSWCRFLVSSCTKLSGTYVPQTCVHMYVKSTHAGRNIFSSTFNLQFYTMDVACWLCVRIFG